MLTTFRAQILFFITLIILITAITIMYFTHRDVGRAILDREEASIENISHFIQLSIRNEYDQLLYSKVDAIRHLKTKLKSLTSLAIAMHQAQAADLLQEIEQKKEVSGAAHSNAIQKIASEWFHSSLLDHEVSWLLYDKNGQALLSSHPLLNSSSITSFVDMKGRSLAQQLTVSSLSRTGEYAVFQLARARDNNQGVWKLGYFMPLKKWNVTLAAIADVSSLLKEEEKSIRRIIRNMQHDFTDLIIAQSGFVLVFDSSKQILVSPDKETTAYLASAVNPQSGQSYLDSFMDTARKDESITYPYMSLNRQKNGLGQKYAVYTTWFRGFDWYISIVLPVAEIQGPGNKLIARQSYIIAGIFFFSLLLCVVLVARISRPLQILTEQIKQLPSHDFSKGDSKALLAMLPVAVNNEAGRLARAFGFMITELQANIKKLVATTARNERMESELNVARDIQLGTLPTNFTFTPEHEEIDLYAYLIPAREVGGDLYDFFFIDDEHLCFTLGDVSDKGVPAALFMVITKVLVKHGARGNPSPADMMTRINEILCEDNPGAMFVTLIIGILNVKTGVLRYANGGHNPPIFTDARNRSSYRDTLSGPIVGAMEGLEYEEISLTMQPGASLFLYTDGVTEAMNSDMELFSDSRLLSDYSALADQPVQEVVSGILEHVKEHAGAAPQSDDIAMMMLRLKASGVT